MKNNSNILWRISRSIPFNFSPYQFLLIWVVFLYNPVKNHCDFPNNTPAHNINKFIIAHSRDITTQRFGAPARNVSSFTLIVHTAITPKIHSVLFFEQTTIQTDNNNGRCTKRYPGLFRRAVCGSPLDVCLRAVWNVVCRIISDASFRVGFRIFFWFFFSMGLWIDVCV